MHVTLLSRLISYYYSSSTNINRGSKYWSSNQSNGIYGCRLSCADLRLAFGTCSDYTSYLGIILSQRLRGEVMARRTRHSHSRISVAATDEVPPGFCTGKSSVRCAGGRCRTFFGTTAAEWTPADADADGTAVRSSTKHASIQIYIYSWLATTTCYFVTDYIYTSQMSSEIIR